MKISLRIHEHEDSIECTCLFVFSKGASEHQVAYSWMHQWYFCWKLNVPLNESVYTLHIEAAMLSWRRYFVHSNTYTSTHSHTHAHTHRPAHKHSNPHAHKHLESPLINQAYFHSVHLSEGAIRFWSLQNGLLSSHLWKVLELSPLPCSQHVKSNAHSPVQRSSLS